jgi:Fe-S cluster biogenesis protein NfuA
LDFIWECENAEEAKKCKLAESLFTLPDVVYLLFGNDFVSVTISQSAEWNESLQSDVVELIAKFLNSNVAFFEKIQMSAKSQYTEIEQKIMQLIEEKIQPALAMHGGTAKFISFQDGILVLDLQGACKGCPSSDETLKFGIQNLIRYYLPEVKEVRHFD